MSYIEDITKMISKLDASELLSISEIVAQTVQNQRATIAMAKRITKILKSSCTFCGFAELIKWGKSKAGTPRFRCNNCKCTLSATANTPLFRLRYRDRWTQYMSLMSNHMSVKALKEHYFPKMSPNTLLRWRHRFLAAFQTNSVEPMSGVIQADEKYFRTSFKGDVTAIEKTDRKARKRGGAKKRGISFEQVAVLTAVDSNGGISQELIGVRNNDNIVKALLPWVGKGSVLVSDGYAAYGHVAHAAQCVHIDIKSDSRSYMNLSKVNNYHSQIENLVNRKCLGVSTRHLMKYFAWMRHITQKLPFGEGMLEMLLA